MGWRGFLHDDYQLYFFNAQFSSDVIKMMLMARRLTNSKKKSGFNVYFDEKEREYLKQKAKEDNYSVSSFIRLLIQQQMEDKNANSL